MWRTLRKQLSDVSELDRDDLLDLIGLEQRRSTAERAVPVAAIFGAGLLVGVGVGLLLARKPGAELRGELKQRLRPAGNNGAHPAAATKDTAVTPS